MARTVFDCLEWLRLKPNETYSCLSFAGGAKRAGRDVGAIRKQGAFNADDSIDL